MLVIILLSHPVTFPSTSVFPVRRDAGLEPHRRQLFFKFFNPLSVSSEIFRGSNGQILVSPGSYFSYMTPSLQASSRCALGNAVTTSSQEFIFTQEFSGPLRNAVRSLPTCSCNTWDFSPPQLFQGPLCLFFPIREYRPSFWS